MISKGSPAARPCAAAVACLLLMLQALPMAGMARAHDPSPYGGVFRSRNMGDAWLNADIGLFLNATLALAVDPRDPEHLLLGTDVGLWRSHNGGRSWTREAEGLIVGAVFAIAFAPDGQSAMCAAPRCKRIGLPGTDANPLMRSTPSAAAAADTRADSAAGSAMSGSGTTKLSNTSRS